MRVGLNLLGLTPGLSGGIELYAKRLVRGIAEQEPAAEFVLFCNASNSEAFRQTVAGRPGWSVLAVRVGARPQGLRVVVEQAALPTLARRARVDVLHSPSYTWPIASSCPGVVTVCDMLYAIWPRAIPSTKRLFWRLAVPMSVKRCKRTITISQDAKKDITKVLKLDPARIVVTYLAGCVAPPAGGLDAETVRTVAQKYAGRSRRFLLSVGAMGRHKNLGTMISAFAQLNRCGDFRDVGLVVTGVDYGIRRDVVHQVDRLGLGRSVSLPGYVPVAELSALYAGASAYLSTSLMEGFGMTAVEAMSFGTPVVVGNRGALPEIVGDGGVVVDAVNSSELADALADILMSPDRAADLSRAALARSRHFSWTKTAEETWAVYRSVVAPQAGTPAVGPFNLTT